MTIRHGKFLTMISDIAEFLLCISSPIASSSVHTNTAHVMYLGTALVKYGYRVELIMQVAETRLGWRVL